MQNICRWSTNVLLFFPPGFSFPSYKFLGRPNALWGHLLWAHPLRGPPLSVSEYLCRLEVVYFLLSHLFMSLSLWSGVLGQDPRLNFLKSVGKLSPLNDMRHYFVALRGKNVPRKWKLLVISSYSMVPEPFNGSKLRWGKICRIFRLESLHYWLMGP